MSESRIIHKRVSTSLVEVAFVEQEPGYVAHRSTCPDGQFWLVTSGSQVVTRQHDRRRQNSSEVMYYAPKEPAIREADDRTFAYGVRLRVSGLKEHERDSAWYSDAPTNWQSKRMVIALSNLAFVRGMDPHEVDEWVAGWIGTPISSTRDHGSARWIREARHLVQADPSISLVDLARMLDLAPAYVSSQFNRATGTSLSQLRRRVMLDNAIRLMPAMGPNEAAIEAGFYDASHFHRACTSELGIKASELRTLLATGSRICS